MTRTSLLSRIYFFTAAPSRILAALFASALTLAPHAGFAASGSFTISTASTTSQTLGSSSGETGIITSAGTLTVGSSTVAVTISGDNETLTNSGTIDQTSTGRAIRDNTGVSGLLITNNAGAIMETADADVIQMNKSPASVTFNNYGQLLSLTPTDTGGQAIDFAAITSGSNIFNNYAGALAKAFNADAIHPGVNGVIYNDGTILSLPGTGNTGNGSGNDGIDGGNNTGIQVTNDVAGLIEGARHGITCGDDSDNVTMTVTNNAGGVIMGDDGSGINIDGFSAAEVVTVTNHGTIQGDGVTADGDGVDVDGLVSLTNSGLIVSLNSVGTSGTLERSEGATVGGGTIINSGTIEGEVANGNTTAVGRGITVAGVDKDTNGNPIPLQGIYGNTTITNTGLIQGQTDSGIAIGGSATSFSVTINNQAGGSIVGGGTSAVITTGSDHTVINNAGAINGSASGLAIDFVMGSGTLNVTGGAASITGNISGGSAGSVMTIDPGAGNSFSYAGTASNFNSVKINSGTVTLSGSNTYTGPTAIAGGNLIVSGSLTASISGTVSAGATLQVDGKFNNAATLAVSGTLKGAGSVGNVSVDNGGTLAPGDSPGILKISNGVAFSGSLAAFSVFLDKTNSMGSSPTAGSDYSQLDITGGSINLNNATLSLGGSLGNLKVDDLLFIIVNGGGSAVTGDFDNLVQGATTTLSGNPNVQFEVSYTASASGDSFAGAGHDVALQVVSVPEPGTWGMAFAGLMMLLAFQRARRRS